MRALWEISASHQMKRLRLRAQLAREFTNSRDLDERLFRLYQVVLPATIPSAALLGLRKTVAIVDCRWSQAGRLALYKRALLLSAQNRDLLLLADSKVWLILEPIGLFRRELHSFPTASCAP